MSWVFVDWEIVVELHRREVMKTHEPVALLDHRLLESALARPRNHIDYDDALKEQTREAACVLAAVYLHASQPHTPLRTATKGQPGRR